MDSRELLLDVDSLSGEAHTSMGLFCTIVSSGLASRDRRCYDFPTACAPRKTSQADSYHSRLFSTASSFIHGIDGACAIIRIRLWIGGDR